MLSLIDPPLRYLCLYSAGMTGNAGQVVFHPGDNRLSLFRDRREIPPESGSFPPPCQNLVRTVSPCKGHMLRQRRAFKGRHRRRVTVDTQVMFQSHSVKAGLAMVEV